MALASEVALSPQVSSTPTSLAADVLAGLSRTPKRLSSAWFYDERGSQLFQRITEQEEYYLTRCEREILERHARDIAATCGPEPLRVVEIGAGDGHKTEILLHRLLAAGLDLEYVPIDICRPAVEALTHKLHCRLGHRPLRVRGIVGDYHDAFPLLGQQSAARTLVLFLGSSIGNFDPQQAVTLLSAMRQALAPGDLALVGFDLKKDPRVILRAYDDRAGVTCEFNFNLLDRLNRELGARFDRERFVHHAAYNLRLSCMESWLVSRARQKVHVAALGREFRFAAWEGIRVERSYKYDFLQIASLAAAGGFSVRRHFTDSRRWFADSLWEAV